MRKRVEGYRRKKGVNERMVKGTGEEEATIHFIETEVVNGPPNKHKRNLKRLNCLCEN